MKLKDLRAHDQRVTDWALNSTDRDELVKQKIKSLDVDLHALALRLEFADMHEITSQELVNDAETIWAAIAFIDCFIDE